MKAFTFRLANPCCTLRVISRDQSLESYGKSIVLYLIAKTWGSLFTAAGRATSRMLHKLRFSLKDLSGFAGSRPASV